MHFWTLNSIDDNDDDENDGYEANTESKWSNFRWRHHLLKLCLNGPPSASKIFE